MMSSSYQDVYVRNPTGSFTIDIPNTGNTLRIVSRFYELDITVTDEKILDNLEQLRNWILHPSPEERMLNDLVDFTYLRERLLPENLLPDQGRLVAYGNLRELFIKYCGNAAVTFDNTEENRKLVDGFFVLDAPAHQLALSCSDFEEEQRIFKRLSEHNVNFRRSNNNIELLTINARQQAARKEQAYEAEEL